MVKHLKIVLNDERYNVVLQALLKENQTAYTTVSVPEGMNTA